MDNRTPYLLLLTCVFISIASCQDDTQQNRPQAFVLNAQEARNIRPRAYQSVNPAPNQLNGLAGSGFRGQLGSDDSAHAPAQQLLRRPNFPQDGDGFQNIPIRPQQQLRRPASQHAQDQKDLRLEEEEDELEKEEPDRLSQLLPNSKFDCVGRSGYYADEGLACEVFHYCQDNTKHSWICPDGFTFHQVHLICMPPSGDNICQKSSQYHFVNDYLYKALNAEEAQIKPNVTLRYSDRFYPSEVYHDGRYDEEDEEEPERVQAAAPRRAPARPAPAQTATQAPSRRPQVFRSPEEVDIPLLQRRPSHVPQPFHPSNNHDFEYEKK